MVLTLKGKLNRMKSHILPEKSSLPKTKEKEPHFLSLNRQENQEFGDLEKWREIGSEPIKVGDEVIFRRDRFFPLHQKHGYYAFERLYEVMEQWNKQALTHPLSAHTLQPSDLLFFDTETTGLGGGAGNTIFMLGYAKVVKEHLQVTQLFLPGPASEVLFYRQFLEDNKESKNIVSYNGKAFDWPQVKTRHTLQRNELPPLPQFGHFDLLHASRRLWKEELPSCRLGIVEEHKLGFIREGDTPGHLAPLLYFEYLQSLDVTPLEGIFQHNEWDVCSLVTLYIHLSLQLLSLAEGSLSQKEYLEIGRWFEALGEAERALPFLQQAMKSKGSYEWIAKHELAKLHKKKKRI